MLTRMDCMDDLFEGFVVAAPRQQVQVQVQVQVEATAL